MTYKPNSAAEPYSIGICATCGKKMFDSRKKARKYVKTYFPQDRMSVYMCGEYFHFGHTPYAVRTGQKARGT